MDAERPGIDQDDLALFRRLDALAELVPALARNTRDLRVLERAAIAPALEDSRHNKSRAAAILGLSRTQLYGRLRRYGLQ